MEIFLSTLQQKICPQCPHGVFGEKEQFCICNLPPGRQCGIKRSLPEVVRIVASMPDAPLNHIRVEVRSRICSHCDQFKSGTCPLTGVGECTLQTYLGQVVEIIREVQATYLGESEDSAF